MADTEATYKGPGMRAHMAVFGSGNISVTLSPVGGKGGGPHASLYFRRRAHLRRLAAWLLKHVDELPDPAAKEGPPS